VGLGSFSRVSASPFLDPYSPIFILQKEKEKKKKRKKKKQSFFVPIPQLLPPILTVTLNSTLQQLSSSSKFLSLYFSRLVLCIIFSRSLLKIKSLKHSCFSLGSC
jgi:uncharacterized membrane protein